MSFCFTLSFLRFWHRFWPLRRGSGLADRIVTQYGRAVKPQWMQVNGYWYLIDLTDSILRSIAVRGTYGTVVGKIIIDNLPASGTFIDVGANVGHISLLAARRVGPQGRVLAVEANPRIASTLKQHVCRNAATNITVVQCACSDTPGTAELFISDRSNSGKCSLSAANAESVRSVVVECECLDSIAKAHSLDRIDVIKVDVEGAELSVLRGMESSLRDFRPLIVLEIEPDLLAAFGTAPADIEEFFRARGYRRERITATDSLFRFAAEPGAKGISH
jgi:FkbM family methyltransferase